MSGGQLALLDSQSCAVKWFPLADGLATLGRDPANDIRITLSSVAPHHASVVVRDNKTVIRAVGGTTLVNGRTVSVATLRHGDVISVAKRSLRWEAAEPEETNLSLSRPTDALVTLPVRRGRTSRDVMRRSVPTPAHPARERALQLAIEMSHRASMPGSTGGKQVAIVQPQRRNASELSDKSAARASSQAASTPLLASTSRRNTSNQVLSTSSPDTEDKSRRKSSSRGSPKNFLNTTKATLWIESRKTGTRRKVQTPPLAAITRRSLPLKKSTPLRLTVLKKAQSARKARVVKIEAPLKIDHTKQAAIRLMTGHTPKSRISVSTGNKSSGKISPSYLVKKPSPVRKTPGRKSRQFVRKSRETNDSIVVTPSRGSTFAQESYIRKGTQRNSGTQSVSVLEISDSTQNSTIHASNVSTRSGRTPKKSPLLRSPKKSAMKDHTKKSIRKTESITFDLSNLESRQDLSSTHTTHGRRNSEDITLHYSESSSHSESPSPPRSIHSRRGKMLELAGASPASPSGPQTSPSRTLTPESPSARRSIRSNAMVQKALETSMLSDRTRTISSPDSSSISDHTRTILNANSTETSDRTKTIPSVNSSRASAFRTRTLSPRSDHNLESYSVVDLVSFDSQDASKSVYNSAGSESSTEFGTPPTTGRKTRSTIGPHLLGTSTPYVKQTRKSRSKSSSNITNPRISSVSTRRSKSLTTPENKHVSIYSTRISRRTRSRSRINDSDLILDDTVAEESPKTSRRSRTEKSGTNDKSINGADNGMSTPENRHSPETASTPVLSIQSLLDSSRSSIGSRATARKSANYKRKTIGAMSEPKRRSRSLGAIVSSVRKTRLRLSQDSDRTDEGAPQPDNDDTVTPRSAVKPPPEAVKDKHSTAKKPLSKRSIIDDLNSSDIVKQLFNSPVKRKLSQSMTEFSRRQLFDDEDDIVKERHPKRRTAALTDRTLNNSSLEPQPITPERFVSPVETPNNSPNVSRGSSQKGGRDSPRPTRSRASVKNDLTNVSGVKRVFAKSPKNDLRRVTGVRALIRHTTPKNDLTDVRGVRRMFQRKSPDNDLRNVSGVKRTLRTSPKNDLTDVRGVKRMFKSQKPATSSYHDLSGVEELFDSSAQSGDRSEVLFDMLVGRPPVKAVYSKSFTSRTGRKSKARRRSLIQPVEMTAGNVHEWLEQELKRRLQAPASRNVTKELQKLSTATVSGSEPIRGSRTRNSTFKSEKSASYIYNSSTLPIKKRSLVEPSREVIRPQLPLKKRAVHSTPVKGRVEVTMNASELGRVSPIAVIHERQYSGQDCFVSRSTQTIDEDTEPVIQTKTRTPRKQDTPKKIDISKSSPQKSPERPKRATRNRRVSMTKQMGTKNRRSSLIVKKKAPAMVPQKSKADTDSTSSVELTKTRSKRTRVPKVSFILGKLSPKIKSQRAARAANKSGPREAIHKTTRARKATTQKPESPKPSPQQKRKTRAKASEESMPKAKKILAEKPVRRGRNATVEVERSLEPKKTRKAKGVSKSSFKEQSPNSQNHTTVTQTRRGRLVQTIEKQPKGRGKRVQNETEPEAKAKQTTRGRIAQNQREPEIEEEITRPNSRGKKAQTQTIVQSNLEEKRINTRAKKVQMSVQSEVEEKRNNTRGKKTNAQTNTASDTEEKRSNTKTTTVSEPKTRRGQKAKPEENQPKTRGKKVKSPLRSPEPTSRSRRAKAEVVVVTETVSRKRKAPITEEIPSKLAKSGPKSVPAEKSRGKQKRDVAVDNKAHNSKQTSARASKSKPVEKKPVIPRGRPAKEVKESVAASTSRGKRKANADPSPNKAAKKAAQRSVISSPTSSRQQRAGGSQVGRSRRR